MRVSIYDLVDYEHVISIICINIVRTPQILKALSSDQLIKYYL